MFNEQQPDITLNPEPIIRFLKEMNEYELATQLLDVFKKISRNYLQWDSLGKMYHSLKAYGRALDCLTLCSSQIKDPEERYKMNANFAKIYNLLNLPENSLQYSTQNLEYNPEDHNARLEQVFSYYLLNQKELSEQMLLELLEKEDLSDEVRTRIRFNLGTYQIRRGEFLQGLEKFYVVGKSIGIWPKIDSPFPFWKGGIHFGKTIVVYAEGGIGDEFVNIRFLKNLAELGFNPVWFSTKRDLYSIWNRNGFQTINDLQEVPENSLHSASMGLPLYLKLKLEDLWTGPYITPDPHFIDKWKYVKRHNQLNIGVRWSGNPLYDQDLHRTLPINALLTSIKMGLINKAVCLHSLQVETYSQDYFYESIDQHGQNLTSYEDTLALLSQMDLVITSCTSIVHAASAMGIPTVVLVPISTYYTWEGHPDQIHSPWYSDQTTIFRQQVYNTWEHPLNQLEQFLNKWKP